MQGVHLLPWHKQVDGEFPPQHQINEISYQNLKEFLANIKHKWNEDRDTVAMEQRIDELFHYYMFNLKVVQPGILFRSTRANRPLEKTSDISYPPAVHASAGRFNQSGQSKLYASTTISTAISEIRPNFGSPVCVSRFVPRRGDSTIKVARLGDLRSTDAPYSERSVDRRNRVFMDFLTQGHNHKKWLLIDDFINEYVTMSEEDADATFYPLTRKIGEIFERMVGCEGLMYPSVQHGYVGYNFAFCPLKFDELYVHIDSFYGNIAPMIDRDGCLILGINGIDVEVHKIAQPDNDGVLRWENQRHFRLSRMLGYPPLIGRD
jgi:hypothetical protein